MRKNILKNLYNAAPEGIKRLSGVIPYPYRMGQKYREMTRHLQSCQYATREELEAYQFSKLKDLIACAGRTIPYYRDLFKSVSFDPERLDSFARMADIPLLSKKDVFDGYERLINPEYTFINSYEGLTGGTTGQPLKLLLSVASHAYEEAFLHAIWHRAGYTPSIRRVSLMGSPFKEKNGSKKIMKLDYFNNQLQLSPQDLDPRSVETYMKEIEKFQPRFLHGFASAITVLAKYLKDNGKHISGIRGTLCGSEQVFSSQRTLIEEVFQSPMLAWYGQTEKVALAGECEERSGYHLFSEYGYTELVDEKGNVIHEPGKAGEIVGTGFINMAMPLIRYRTGDWGEYGDGPCKCGRNYPRLIKVKGRRGQEFLFGSQNEVIPLTALDMQGPAFNKIYQLQFEQKTPGVADLNIASDKTITAEDMETIKNELASQVGEKMTFDIRISDHFQKTSTGKLKACIQHLENR